MLLDKETLFNKFADPFHFLKMIFEKSTKLRMIYFNVAVNVTEITIQNETSLPVLQEP